MAALPFYILILGTAVTDSPLPLGGVEWVEVSQGKMSLVEPADSFSWSGAAAYLISDMVDSGYAFAALSVTRSELRNDTLFISTTVDSGPRVEVTTLSFSGNRKTNPGLLAHLAGFKSFTFSTPQVEKLIAALDQLDCRVLDWELVQLQPESGLLERGKRKEDTSILDDAASSKDVLSPANTAVLPVNLHFLVDEGRRFNRLSALVGYADEEGFTGMVDVMLSNTFGGRRELYLSWRRLAANNVTFALSARDPYPFRLPVGVEGGGAFRSYDENSYHLEGSLGAFVPSPNLEAGVGYVYERDKSGSIEITKNLGSTRLNAGPLDADLRVGQRREEEQSAYLKAWGKLSLTPALPWRFSFYIEPNAAVVASKDSLIASELVAVGGARTLRGYLEEEFLSEWGLWSRQELRWGSEIFSLYPLFDAAWIEGSGFAAGYGAGLAVATPVGRFQLDAALPLGGELNQAKLHLSLDAEF